MKVWNACYLITCRTRIQHTWHLWSCLLAEVRQLCTDQQEVTLRLSHFSTFIMQWQLSHAKPAEYWLNIQSALICRDPGYWTYQPYANIPDMFFPICKINTLTSQIISRNSSAQCTWWIRKLTSNMFSSSSLSRTYRYNMPIWWATQSENRRYPTMSSLLLQSVSRQADGSYSGFIGIQNRGSQSACQPLTKTGPVGLPFFISLSNSGRISSICTQ